MTCKQLKLKLPDISLTNQTTFFFYIWTGMRLGCALRKGSGVRDYPDIAISFSKRERKDET